MSTELKKFDELTLLRTEHPPVDVLENTEGFLVRADLPGVHEADLELELENGVLTLSGNRRLGNTGYVRYARRFHVPRETDPDAVRAHLDRGVLNVTVPKAEAAKPRRISVNAG